MTAMQMTVFSTPILTPFLRFLALMGLKLSGWQVQGDIAAVHRVQKAVLIGAPHTSNWDFIVMLAVMLACRLDVHWMGKHTLFPWPLAGFMRWLGGISIDRRQAHNTVSEMVDVFKKTQHLVVIIPPEGTRKKVERWKTGFYHIAHGAGVPIILGFLNYPAKSAGFAGEFYPTGDIESDLPKIQAFYADKIGKNPHHL